MSAKNCYGLLALVFILFALQAAEGFKFPGLKIEEDAGDPLFLTNLIKSGNITEAREKATVSHQQMNHHMNISYSGYFTVNKIFNYNLFFWFIPAQANPDDAPVVLYLCGGPGSPSVLSLLLENGPFSVTKNKTLKTRKYSWSKNHNMIYIDVPVGVGYSFTDDRKGHASTKTDVSRDLLTALVQFFELFPELRENPFFTAGVSYAGKYVVAISHAIMNYNIEAEAKINLQGLAIASGWTDPINQINYGDYLYQLGLVDDNARDQFREYEAEVQKMIRKEKFQEAFDLLEVLILGDIPTYPTYFTNVTGFTSYVNYLHPEWPYDIEDWATWIQQPDVRRAIHVGNVPFNGAAGTAFNNMQADLVQSEAHLLADLLDHYRVMYFNGQLDVIVNYPSTKKFLQNLNWTGAEKYKKAVKKQWKVGNELAGYTKSVDNLTEVLVRNAGHSICHDQPEWALDLITRFIRGEKF